jgi:hypothetical protein
MAKLWYLIHLLPYVIRSNILLPTGITLAEVKLHRMFLAFLGDSAYHKIGNYFGWIWISNCMHNFIMLTVHAFSSEPYMQQFSLSFWYTQHTSQIHIAIYYMYNYTWRIIHTLHCFHWVSIVLPNSFSTVFYIIEFPQQRAGNHLVEINNLGQGVL